MTFETSKRLDKWMKKHREKCVSRATDGAQFIWEFLTNGNIEYQTITCMCCSEKFTDYVD